MYGICAALDGNIYDRVHIQVGLQRVFVRTYLVGLVSLVPMQGIPVLISKYGHCLYMQFGSRTRDAYCYFAPVGNQ